MKNRTATFLRLVCGISAVTALLVSTTFVGAADDYKLGPDSKVQPGVPQGTVAKRTWESKTVYPGTVRDYWIYVPAQYEAKTPACVMDYTEKNASHLEPRNAGIYRI